MNFRLFGIQIEQLCFLLTSKVSRKGKKKKKKNLISIFSLFLTPQDFLRKPNPSHYRFPVSFRRSDFPTATELLCPFLAQVEEMLCSLPKYSLFSHPAGGHSGPLPSFGTP